MVEILALTDVGAAYAQPVDGSVHKTLAAFKYVDKGTVQEGLYETVAHCAAEAQAAYLAALPADAIVRVAVERDRNQLVMQGVPAPAEDEDLAALLAQQTAEDSFVTARGRFVFDRTDCVYRCLAAWNEGAVTLEVEREQDAPVFDAVCAAAQAWEDRVRAALADEGFPQDAALDSVSADAAGELTFWLTAGDSIASVSASADEGVTGVMVL